MRVILLAACLVAFHTLTVQAQTPPTRPQIIEGTRTDTARSAGHWRAWFNASDARVVCANADAMWFEKGGNVWRYNTRQQKVDVWTSVLTHPDLNDFMLYGAISTDGRFAVSCRAAIFLWDGKVWTRLPMPEGNANSHHLAFDSEGQLWANSGYKAFRWDGVQWGSGFKIPKNTGTWAQGDGWFMWNNFGQGKEWKTFSFFDRRFAVSTEYPAEAERLGMLHGAYQVGGKLMGIFGGWGRPGQVCEIRGNDVVPLATGRHVILDLSAGEAMIFDPNAEQVTKPDGTKIVAMPTPPGLLKGNGSLFRDAHGHFWMGPWRHDGNSWKQMLPPHAFKFEGDMLAAMESGRLVFDETMDTWVDARPEIPINVVGYDAARRTGWLQRNALTTQAPAVWDQFQFAADGSRKLLRKIEAGPKDKTFPTVAFETSDGQVWLGGDFRWDGNVMHDYDNGHRGVRSQKEGMARLVKDANGAVWMYHTDRSWRKFNPAKDAFEPAEPFDSFAFKFGQTDMAIVGLPVDRSWDWCSHLGMIYRKGTAGWEPLLNPFIGDEYVTRGQEFGKAPLLGVGGKCVWKSRMLVSCYLGVFEWDSQSDRWAYLAPQKCPWAFYDAAGRRVIVMGRAGHILRYEGDPFAQVAASGPARNLEARILQLLKGMDDDAWPVREEATREAINLIRKDAKEVAAILRQPKLTRTFSAELAARVELVLKETPAVDDMSGHEGKQLAVDRTVGNSLLERMYPPMPAVADYVIKVGASYEPAKSAFVAAGAKHSSEVHNGHYPDLSYQGFLLPDNTMVYIRVENKDGSGKILSLGLGAAGKGNQADWPWDDAEKNSLKTLELKPYSSRILD